MSLATITMLSYLLVGGMGLGVFAGGAAGWAVLTGSTAGYLIGFVLATPLVGYLAQRGWQQSHWQTASAMLLGNIVIYICGLIWLNQFAPDLATTLQWGLWPFIPGDIIKIILASWLVPSVQKMLTE